MNLPFISKLSSNKALISGKNIKSTIKFVQSICQEAILLADNSSVSYCQQMDTITIHDLAELADQILKIERQLGRLEKSGTLQMEIGNNLRELIGNIELLINTTNNKKVSLH